MHHIGDALGPYPNLASMALPGTLLAPGWLALPRKLWKPFIAADGPQQHRELSVADSHPQLVLQLLLGGSQRSAGPNQVLTGHSDLRAFWKVVTSPGLAQELNLQLTL